MEEHLFRTREIEASGGQKDWPIDCRGDPGPLLVSALRAAAAAMRFERDRLLANKSHDPVADGPPASISSKYDSSQIGLAGAPSAGNPSKQGEGPGALLTDQICSRESPLRAPPAKQTITLSSPRALARAISLGPKRGGSPARQRRAISTPGYGQTEDRVSEQKSSVTKSAARQETTREPRARAQFSTTASRSVPTLSGPCHNLGRRRAFAQDTGGGGERCSVYHVPISRRTPSRAIRLSG